LALCPRSNQEEIEEDCTMPQHGSFRRLKLVPTHTFHRSIHRSIVRRIDAGTITLSTAPVITTYFQASLLPKGFKNQSVFAKQHRPCHSPERSSHHLDLHPIGICTERLDLHRTDTGTSTDSSATTTNS